MRIFITGVSRGLGLALTRLFLSQGHSVVGVGRSEFNLQLIDKKCQSLFAHYTCDITIPDQVDRIFEILDRNHFVPDVVVLNAGTMEDDITDKGFDFEKFQRVMEINCTSQIRWVGKFIPIFQKQGHGILIGISSLAAMRGVVCSKVAYSASKSALNMAFEGFRLLLGDAPVRFITVNLGRMDEKRGLLKASYDQTAKKIASLIDRRCSVVNFPFLISLLWHFSKLFSDSFIHKTIVKGLLKKDFFCQRYVEKRAPHL